MAIGQQVRKLRHEAGAHQDDFVFMARGFGLDWSRATIAALELGHRELSLEEFHALAYVLTETCARNIELADLLPPDVEVALTPYASVSTNALRQHLRGRGGQVREALAVDHGLEVWTDAEERLAAQLGVDPSALQRASRRLWGRRFIEERDQRVNRRANADTPPRSMQALRGHVSRELLGELRPTLKRGPSKSRRQ